MVSGSGRRHTLARPTGRPQRSSQRLGGAQLKRAGVPIRQPAAATHPRKPSDAAPRLPWETFAAEFMIHARPNAPTSQSNTLSAAAARNCYVKKMVYVFM